jgi:hypothetical protein
MRAIQGNLTKARELVEQLLRRERKKRDIVVRPACYQVTCSLHHQGGVVGDLAPSTGMLPGLPACSGCLACWASGVVVMDPDEPHCKLGPIRNLSTCRPVT